jgi:hypothetical protein
MNGFLVNSISFTPLELRFHPAPRMNCGLGLEVPSGLIHSRLKTNLSQSFDKESFIPGDLTTQQINILSPDFTSKIDL